MQAPLHRSTALVVRYVPCRRSATTSSGTSTGRPAVAPIPLRITASERVPRAAQSQPCRRAARTASMRLRVPVLPIAEDR